MVDLKKISCGALLITSSLITTQVLAESYWGVGFGNSSFDIKPVFGSVEVDDATAFKLVVGTRSGNAGFEMDFSYASYDWTGYSSVNHNVSNLVFAGLGYLPVSDSVDLYGKIGLNLWSTAVDIGETNYDGDDSIGLSVGGGVDLELTESTHIRAEYQMLNGIGDGLDEGDISNVIINLVFSL